MTTFRENWNEKKYTRRQGYYYVDLRGLRNEDAIVGAFWGTLRGPGYPPENYPGKGYVNSLDALTEVIADFLLARWGQETRIVVIGGEVLPTIGLVYFASVIDTLGRAIELALVTKIRTCKDIEEIEKGVFRTRCSIYMS